MLDSPSKIGSRVQYPEFGTGIVVRSESGGFLTVSFQAVGERRVPASAPMTAMSWNERVISGVRPADSRSVQRSWWALEAERLPLMETAATSTADRVTTSTAAMRGIPIMRVTCPEIPMNARFRSHSTAPGGRRQHRKQCCESCRTRIDDL